MGFVKGTASEIKVDEGEKCDGEIASILKIPRAQNQAHHSQKYS